MRLQAESVGSGVPSPLSASAVSAGDGSVSTGPRGEGSCAWRERSRGSPRDCDKADNELAPGHVTETLRLSVTVLP